MTDRRVPGHWQAPFEHSYSNAVEATRVSAGEAGWLKHLCEARLAEEVADASVELVVPVQPFDASDAG